MCRIWAPAARPRARLRRSRPRPVCAARFHVAHPCTGVASSTRRGIFCADFLCSRLCQCDTIRRCARADIYHAFLLAGAAVQHKPRRACAFGQLKQLPVSANGTGEVVPARRALDFQRSFHAHALLPCCARRGSRRFSFWCLDYRLAHIRQQGKMLDFSRACPKDNTSLKLKLTYLPALFRHAAAALFCAAFSSAIP